MQLYRWQGAARNFGDELNTLIWPRLLPDFFDERATELFLGIGSVLDARHPPHPLKVVAGAGYGGYESPPALDESWAIHWVRGPRTARYLGLPESMGLGDPAMLLRHAGWGVNTGGSGVGFMPHFESAERGAWQQAAETAGLRLIDPRDDPAAIVAAIGRCRMLLCEALHGAIVADTLRVPWIALRPQAPVHRAKWHDWADTLGLAIAFQPLRASSLFERLHVSRLARHHTGRQLMSACAGSLRRVARQRFAERAALVLARAAGAAPCLSDSNRLEACQARMLARLDAVRRTPRFGDAAALALRHRGNSAYHARSAG